MCGRFSLAASGDEIRAEFGIGPEPDLSPRYNIAPQAPIAVLGRSRAGTLRWGLMRWGLVPRWARDEKIGGRLINARAESVREKATFRDSFARRRCLVIADGFFEWRRIGSGRVPMRIVDARARPMAFAGIWDRWTPLDAEPLYSCAIVTTAPNATMQPIHDRMPAILDRTAREAWLASETAEDRLQDLLRPYAGQLTVYEVSTIVNSARNDVPECIVPVRPSALQPSLEIGQRIP